MSSLQRWLFVAIFVALLGLYGAVLNLGAFAVKGPRYTKLDGDTKRSERVLADLELQRQQEAERQERITTDLALAARIDLLEENCGHGF